MPYDRTKEIAFHLVDSVLGVPVTGVTFPIYGDLLVCTRDDPYTYRRFEGFIVEHERGEYGYTPSAAEAARGIVAIRAIMPSLR